MVATTKGGGMVEHAPVFTKFYKLTDWILDRLERYPRTVRIILADRMGALCLEILDQIIQALYTKDSEFHGQALFLV